jgi:hypothetical protein
VSRRRILALTAFLALTLAGLAWLAWPRASSDPGDTGSEQTEPRQIAVQRPRPTLPPATERSRQQERERQAGPSENRTPNPMELGTDTAGPLSFEGHLYIEIVDTEGYPVEEAGMSLRGDCGRAAYRVTEGEADLVVDEGRCTLIAWRQDGALRTLSDRVQVDVLGGDEVDITLVLPTERTGGLGVQIEEDRNGMRVVMVVPGSPAEQAGLQAGDLITEVDGTSVGLLSIQDFVQVMTGAEGTDVNFVVEYEEDTGIVAEPIVVTRAFLEG